MLKANNTCMLVYVSWTASFFYLLGGVVGEGKLLLLLIGVQ